MTYPPQQPDPYGNQPPWVGGQPGYGVGPPPPPKPKTGLIAALIIVGILVIGGGGVGAYFLLSDDKGAESGGSGGGGTDNGDPKAVAEKFADAYETAINVSSFEEVDIKDLQPLLCAGDYRKLEEQVSNGREGEKSASARPEKRPGSEEIDVGAKDVKVDGDSGTFKLTGTRKSGEREKDRPLDLERKDGEWRVCVLFKKRDDEDDNRPSTTKRKPIPTIRPSS